MYKSLMASVAALALVAAGTAFAQSGSTAAPTQSMHAQWQARHAAHMQKRLAALKAKLKITSSQESAWDSYAAAVKTMHTPPARPMKKPSSGLTPAPQIFNAMAEHANARAEQAKKLAAAVGELYGKLDKTQRAVLDTHFADMRAMMMHHHHRMMHKMSPRHVTPMHPPVTATAHGE